MPYALTFSLDPEESDALPPYPGRAFHTLFYQWLALGDYSPSTRVHDQNVSFHSIEVNDPS